MTPAQQDDFQLQGRTDDQKRVATVADFAQLIYDEWVQRADD
jgi:hypothetical protein